MSILQLPSDAHLDNSCLFRNARPKLPKNKTENKIWNADQTRRSNFISKSESQSFVGRDTFVNLDWFPHWIPFILLCLLTCILIVGSTFTGKPEHNSCYSGLLYGYNETMVRLWVPYHISTNNACVGETLVVANTLYCYNLNTWFYIQQPIVIFFYFVF